MTDHTPCADLHAIRADQKAQSDRHHDALTRITEVTTSIQVSNRMILDNLVGTLDKPGLVHRVAALEARGRVAWWSERGTKLVDALLGFLVAGVLFLLLSMGFRATIRDIIQQSVSDVSLAQQIARKAPKDPSCPGCAPTVADAR